MILDSRRKSPRGATPIELLVVLGIIAIGVGLLVPRVQAARDLARMTECTNNLRSIGLATNLYALNFDGFPPSVMSGLESDSPGGPRAMRFSPQVMILPYIDSSPFYSSINFGVPLHNSASLGLENRTAASTRLTFFLCPSDPTAHRPGDGPCAISYRANLGPCDACPEEGHGAFSALDLTRPESFTDGAANTILLAEKLIGTGDGPYDPRRDWLEVPTRTPRSADGWVDVCRGQTDPSHGRFRGGRTWMIAGGIDTYFYTATTPNSPVPDCGTASDNNGVGVFSARSDHPLGVNVVMADGACRRYQSTISPAIWRALSTRDLGDLVGPESGRPGVKIHDFVSRRTHEHASSEEAPVVAMTVQGPPIVAGPTDDWSSRAWGMGIAGPGVVLVVVAIGAGIARRRGRGKASGAGGSER